MRGRWRSIKTRRPARARIVNPRDWLIWKSSPAFLVLVALVEIPAIAAIFLTSWRFPVSEHNLATFALLAGLSVVHLETNLHAERTRELAAEGSSYVDLKSIWTFAGLILLPPSLVAALIALTYTHSWLRVGTKITPHRWTYSAATVVVASLAGGGLLLAVSPHSYPGLPAGSVGVAAIAAAAVVRWFVNSALVGVALPLITPGKTWRRAFLDVFGSRSDGFIELASLSLGAGVALALATNAAWLLVFIVPVLVVQRGLLLRRFQHAAQRDPDTGVLQAPFWHELAEKLIERAHRLNSTAGLLLIHLDDAAIAACKRDREAIAQLRRAAADILRANVREDDLLGLDGRDFILLVPDVDTRGLQALIERLQAAFRTMLRPASAPFGGLTVSIGGALHPIHATVLDELIVHADLALFSALALGPDTSRISGLALPTLPTQSINEIDAAR
jgi:diguanylate cyclase (GGDEF)-like protein